MVFREDYARDPIHPHTESTEELTNSHLGCEGHNPTVHSFPTEPLYKAGGTRSERNTKLQKKILIDWDCFLPSTENKRSSPLMPQTGPAGAGSGH